MKRELEVLFAAMFYHNKAKIIYTGKIEISIIKVVYRALYRYSE